MAVWISPCANYRPQDVITAAEDSLQPRVAKVLAEMCRVDLRTFYPLAMAMMKVDLAKA